jgi:hypothetical protein
MKGQPPGSFYMQGSVEENWCYSLWQLGGPCMVVDILL